MPARGGCADHDQPGFMTRQIAEIAESESGIRIHLTSLNPLRPDNRADACPDHGADVIALNVAADTALYRVKEGGRNGYGMASRRVVPQVD